MRFVKVLQFLFLLLLALALFGGEVVESAYFVDDVSNDYVQAPPCGAQQVANKRPVGVVYQNSVNMAEELILNLAAVPSVELSRFSSSDLLLLISIQRK